MRRCKRIYALILALVLALSFAAPSAAAAAEAMQIHRAIVVFDDAVDRDLLIEQLEVIPGSEILYRYDRLFSGAAVSATKTALAAAEDLPGVKKISLTYTHALPQSVDAPLLTSNSLDLMGLSDQCAYTGDGIVVAVIDTGLRYTHQAFAEHDLAHTPALSREDIDAFVDEGGTPGVYLSSRIPFAYDYGNGDSNVFSVKSHGTHVTALAAGYAAEEDGTVLFRGVAPAAQILSMKVFSDGAEYGADDAAILKALEDACALEADVVCLALGHENGFARDNILDGLYSAVFQSLRKQGIILCCAAGNDGDALAAKTSGTMLPTADYTDYGILASPASYLGSTPIAAAEAVRYVDTGYIAAGDRQISYINAVSSAGETLPALETLADTTLPLLAVDGVGRVEDYKGLNARGKIVLVRRGEISFTEKTANAAAAGAVACLIYNSEAASVRPISETTRIPCAAITRADGEYLLALLEKGHLSATIRNEPFVVETAGEPTMLAQSSWGTTSDLRLTPALTAPGGNIFSASAVEDHTYEQLSGTSMAAPNAAGACALALEQIYATGISDKAEAAEMALALLTGTAKPMTASDGTPLSPRRQGAGLIDLSSALDTPFMIRDPLLEAGDNAAGQFTLSFRVKNLSENPLELQISPTVLTDDYIEQEGTFYSLLSPLDITAGITVTGQRTISLPAGGEQWVTLQLTVETQKKEELGNIFPNGFFVEGFVTLTAADGASAHATFLGYCGDWEASPIVEQQDFRDVINSWATGKHIGPVNMGVNRVQLSASGLPTETAPLLGDNEGLTVPYHEDRAAISTSFSSAPHYTGRFFSADLYTLRNAQHLIMVISDRNTGRIYFAQDKPYLPRAGAALDPFTGQIPPSAQFVWGGTDPSGQPLNDGTQVQVAFYGWVESDTAACTAYEASGCTPENPESYRFLTSGALDRCLQWSFSLTIDRTAPTVHASTDNGAAALSLTIRDDQFLSRVTVKDDAGQILAEEYLAEDRAGTPHTLQLDLSGREVLPEYLYVTASDYASNTTGYAIHLSDNTAPRAKLCPMSLLTDVDMDAWYHDAVDYVWTAGMMEGKLPLTFSPRSSATRADVISALYALAGSPETAWTDLPFTDVHRTDDYCSALQWAYGKGIVTGYDATTFAAFASISRQQLAVMLYRYAQISGGTEETSPAALESFADGETVSSWASEAMAWATEEGILSGDSSGLLAPRRSATRAELAQILMNFMHR